MYFYINYDQQVDFSSLIGKTLLSIAVNEYQDEILFTTTDGERFIMYHDQSCCESVSVESIVGDLDDLIGSPILKAEEATSSINPDGVIIEWQESFTWTFYKLATIKGYVDIRWYGSSNGYYSESVEFALLNDEQVDN